MTHVFMTRYTTPASAIFCAPGLQQLGSPLRGSRWRPRCAHVRAPRRWPRCVLQSVCFSLVAPSFAPPFSQRPVLALRPTVYPFVPPATVLHFFPLFW